MAEGNDQQGANGTQGDPTGSDPHGAGPETVSKAEYDKLLAQSRKWEERSKANAAKAKELDELKAATQTDAEELAAAQKRAADAEAKVAEYEREAERAAIVAEVAAEKGVDADLLSRMAGKTRDEVEKDADLIAAKLAGNPLYPNVSDNGAGNGSPITKEQIDSIKNPRERVRMRAQHLELYK